MNVGQRLSRDVLGRLRGWGRLRRPWRRSRRLVRIRVLRRLTRLCKTRLFGIMLWRRLMWLRIPARLIYRKLLLRLKILLRLLVNRFRLFRVWRRVSTSRMSRRLSVSVRMLILSRHRMCKLTFGVLRRLTLRLSMLILMN